MSFSPETKHAEIRPLHPLSIMVIACLMPLAHSLFPSSGSLLFSVLFSAALLFLLQLRRCAVLSVLVFALLRLLGFVFSVLLPLPLVILFLRMILLLFPSVLIAIALLRGYHCSELMAGLERLHLPKVFVLALTVTLRYIPTFAEECRILREAMLTRGVRPSFRHPLRSLEYLIVPQLFRCLALSHELTAAGIRRGVLFPGKRVRYFDRPLRVRDAVWPLVFLLGIFFCFLKGAAA